MNITLHYKNIATNQTITIIILVTWCASSPTQYRHTSTIKKLFGSASSVQSINDFWYFMENDFLNGMYVDEWEHTGISKYGDFHCPNYLKTNGMDQLYSY